MKATASAAITISVEWLMSESSVFSKPPLSAMMEICCGSFGACHPARIDCPKLSARCGGKEALLDSPKPAGRVGGNG